MQDKADIFTVDFLNAPAPGRPRTATEEKKKADAAERARRYRQRKLAVVPGNESPSINRVVNTHEIKLCLDTESDFMAIWNWSNWMLGAFDANGNLLPDSYCDLQDHAEEIKKCVEAIARRAGVVWCNPNINRELWRFRQDD